MTFPSGWQLVLLVVVLVVVFGSAKLPGAARSIGQSLRIFKAETRGLRGEEDDAAAPEVRHDTSTAPRQDKQELPAPGAQTTAPTEQPQNNRDNNR